MRKFFLHKIICLIQKKSNIAQKNVKILWNWTTRQHYKLQYNHLEFDINYVNTFNMNYDHFQKYV
jgi:hypothetical protein